MRYLFLCVVFVLLCGVVLSNNIKISSEARVVDFVGAAKDTAVVEFNLSWDNSWRDDFNWDAAWIFLKYKKRGSSDVWHHAYLSREGHEATPMAGNEGGSYTFMFSEVGTGATAKVTGLYLLRDDISEGKVNARVQIKWPIKSNPKQTLSASDFGTNRDSIYVSAYATEMVYVPVGGYCLGDGYSKNSFIKNGNGPIPPQYDVVDNKSGYTITGYPAHYQNSGPSNVADRVNSPNWNYSYGWHIQINGATWWKIDYKSPKEIKYFGVAPPNDICTTNRIPIGLWRLEGSNDDATWKKLWEGNATEWSSKCGALLSYPVQQSIRVTEPGSYRYYRLYFDRFQMMVLMNLAMSEEELYPDGCIFQMLSEDKVLLTDLKTTEYDLGIGEIPAAYPKGYRGYYMMKYEVNQEQYVAFLNTLTLGQQKKRVANSDFDKMASGDYVFGSLKRPDCRNGIALFGSQGANLPVIFGNNLNPEDKFYSDNDGQTIACNYLSPADMLAYCDWAGLRPMSEMEYEKACRRPTPQMPDKGEYAWNSNAGLKALRSAGDLVGAQTESEAPSDYRMNVNSGGKLNGPLRNGAFATSRTSQLESGGTYWGAMEMSGNLWEMCYNANTEGRKFIGDNVNYSHGDGYIVDAGTDIAATYWPQVKGAIAVRGGSFSSSDSSLRTSDRMFAGGNYFKDMNQRDSSVGFRAVRSVLNTSGFTAGSITCQNGQLRDTVCQGAVYTITGTAPENAIGKLSYLWYLSKDNGAGWGVVKGQTGVNLVYEDLVNETNNFVTLLFKRTSVCAVGEVTTPSVSLLISPVLAVPDVVGEQFAGLGYKFQFPCPPADGLQCKWGFPGGVELLGPTVEIARYTEVDDGVYKVSYVNEKGCESKKIEVKVKGIEGIPLINYGSYRAWADGTYSKSANTYLHPAKPYVYIGATGTGSYKIDVDGPDGGELPMNAYCDMTRNSGGWTLLFHHNTNGGFWAGKDASKYNIGDPTNALYSILYLVEKFRSKDGAFLFWLDYPTQPTLYNIWKQTADPNTFSNLNITGYAPGYKAVNVRATGDSWGGLGLSNNGSSYIDGTFYVGNWWYSIGCRADYGGSSFPGPNSICVNQVRLWIRDEF